MVCCLVVAVLAVTPQTRTARVALWPIVALLALRAVVSVDMSLGQSERKILDALLAVSVFRHKPPQTSLGGRTYTDFPLVLHVSYYYPYPRLDVDKRAPRATPPPCE